MTAAPEMEPIESGSDPIVGSDGEEVGTSDPEEADASDLDAQLAPSLDAGTGAEDGATAVKPDANGLDANIDSALTDGGKDGSSPLSDGGDAASTPDANFCAPSQLTKWRQFQTADAFTTALANCAMPLASCAQPGCPGASCLREQAGVDGCSACIAEELYCAATLCADDCRAGGSRDACGACSCFMNCASAERSCGMGSTDVCASCSQGTCGALEAGQWYTRELGPQISQSAPQLVAFSRARGSIEVVWINDDGNVSYLANEPTSGLALGTAPVVLPGASPSALVRGSLAVAAWGGQKADIVARGSDNRLWHRTLTGITPSDWDSPPEANGLRAGDRLSIVARGPLLRDAVFAGQDGHLHVVTWQAGSSRVLDLGAPDGVSLDGPHMVARAANRLDLVARGSDGRVHFKSMLNDSWSSGWTSFAPSASSPLVGRPQIASGSSASVELYWDEDDPAGDGTLLKRTVRLDDVWGATSDISHAVSTDPIKNYLREEPSCASVLPGRVDCVLRSINGDPGIVSIFASAPHWTNGWPDTDLGPYPASLTSWGPGDVVVVYGTTSGHVAAVLYR